VDLSAAPFHLDETARRWVESTIASMTIDEKIGQLFINHNNDYSPEYLDSVIDRFHPGGMRYRPGPAAAIQSHLRYAQSRSRIPLLIASNPETGGNGAAIDGTLVSTHLQAGSHPDRDIARQLGRIAGVESSAIGCNWAFSPVVDIQHNWRNTVVATRSFGNDPELVIDRALAYLEGLRESGVAAAIKHFPGDGVDERDQHVVTTYNTLDADEWFATYGRVYQALIEAGVPSIMAGHIGSPALSRRHRPDLADDEIRPATLAPELLGDLLRGELGFNGLIVSDASQMIGFTQAMPRRHAVPAAIAAGCDMFLFFRNAADDFEFMMDGHRDGIITDVRLDDALHRILGLKAMLGLHMPDRELVPDPSALELVGSPPHHAVAADIADKTVTLVKDTAGNLPLTPTTHPRIRLYGVAGAAGPSGPSPYLAVMAEELETLGFEVSTYQTLPSRRASGDTTASFNSVIVEEASADYAERFDAAILVANLSGFATDPVLRISWSSPMAPEIPWYATEVPTVFVSLNLPNHLPDVPMVRTVVHAHNDSREAIHAAVQKIAGLSEFHGTFNDNVFGDSFGTRA
jgi:beta-N-acetylhexosaminidase